ncbi:MAG TPA: hypothetical protein VE934_06440 [Polaromonas sp.]|uniref:hypothetical protein n=1 Tax=Polaromonas sp. TaxID=1869339 RepID=UPI002D5DBB3F|nr:hypothetical protein [Polaromonas sp.]HYW56577.1 hypothetical protein [Polaromonas sp.]
MTRVFKYTLGALLPLLLSTQALACYTVYNRANQVIYHASTPPVDMQYQLHQTLPAVFTDGHMVFSVTDTNCPKVNVTRTSRVNMSGGDMQRGATPRQPRG